VRVPEFAVGMRSTVFTLSPQPRLMNLQTSRAKPSKGVSISCRLGIGALTRRRLSYLRISPADNNAAVDVIAAGYDISSTCGRWCSAQRLQLNREFIVTDLKCENAKQMN
jgi:hypothetical protein